MKARTGKKPSDSRIDNYSAILYRAIPPAANENARIYLNGS